MAAPVCITNSVAPIRICDNRGWADTWFAKYGAIFNIGVFPYAEAYVAACRIGAGARCVGLESHSRRRAAFLATWQELNPAFSTSLSN